MGRERRGETSVLIPKVMNEEVLMRMLFSIKIDLVPYITSPTCSLLRRIDLQPKQEKWKSRVR